MKILITSFLLAVMSSSLFADDAIFTVKNVGVSRNSDTIIIDIEGTIPGSSCGDSDEFKLDKTDDLADQLLSLQLQR